MRKMALGGEIKNTQCDEMCAFGVLPCFLGLGSHLYVGRLPLSDTEERRHCAEAVEALNHWQPAVSSTCNGLRVESGTNVIDGWVQQTATSEWTS